MEAIKIGCYERTKVAKWAEEQPEEAVSRLKDALKVVKYDFTMEKTEWGLMVRLASPYATRQLAPIPAEQIIFDTYMGLKNDIFC